MMAAAPDFSSKLKLLWAFPGSCHSDTVSINTSLTPPIQKFDLAYQTRPGDEASHIVDQFEP